MSDPHGHPARDDDGGASPGDEPLVETTADGSLTLRDVRLDQTYHSGHGALAEARHVFLDGSGAHERLASGRATRVLEVGLGTGLNLLLTADAAVTAGAELHYRALDTRLPSAALLRALDHGRHLVHPDLAASWLALRGTSLARHGIVSLTLARGVQLDVSLGDATRARTLEEPGWAHAIYHDAFSPDAAPGLWSERFLARLAHALAPGGVLVTYSVKGEVRRRLAALGLHVEKAPGPPGGKREMLRAVRPI